MIATQEKKEITFLNYRVESMEKEENGRTKFIARGFRATPKAHHQKEKCVFAHYWFTDEQRQKFVQEFQQRNEAFEARVAEAKKNKSALKKEMKNPYKIGDILYTSWGYEQTNVDFFQVTQLGPKSIKARKIGCQVVENSAGHDSCSVKPNKDEFVGDEQTYLIQLYVDSEGKPNYYVKEHGRYSMRPYDMGEKGAYCSWGH